MVVHAVGACLLARLMRLDRDAGPDTAWLLFGPCDPEIVSADHSQAEAGSNVVQMPRPWLLAAE